MVFVRAGFLGDRLQVRARLAGARFARGTIAGVESPSPYRVAAPCPTSVDAAAAPSARRSSGAARLQVQAGRGLPRTPRRSRLLRAAADHRGPGYLRLPEQDGVHCGPRSPPPSPTTAGRAATRRRGGEAGPAGDSVPVDEPHRGRRGPAATRCHRQSTVPHGNHRLHEADRYDSVLDIERCLLQSDRMNTLRGSPAVLHRARASGYDQERRGPAPLPHAPRGHAHQRAMVNVVTAAPALSGSSRWPGGSGARASRPPAS